MPLSKDPRPAVYVDVKEAAHLLGAHSANGDEVVGLRPVHAVQDALNP